LAENPKREITTLAENEKFLLPQGDVVVGGIKPDELTHRLGIKPVMSPEGVDMTPQAVRDLTGTIRMDWSTPDVLRVQLPNRVTDEQVRHLSRYFDNNQIPQVELMDAKGVVTPLATPLGAQVEDAIFETAKQYATKKSRLTPELIDQYRRTGVFSGQAGLLHDGSPVEIRSKSGFNYRVYDHTAKKEFNVHETKISTLPTTLEDQFKPNNLFASYLPDEERLAIANLRRSLEAGLGKPITKFGQLEMFAGSRGFIAERLGKGRVGIRDLASGERQTFENIQAAVANLRTVNRPTPDLTPDDLKRLVGGETNIGFVGPNGRPPIGGEQIPVPMHIVAKHRYEQDVLPGAGESLVKPMRRLFQDIQERTGLPTGDIFMNIQARTVDRQNWNARWIQGRGRVLPNGIKSLDKINKMAGKDADWDKVTAWREAGSDPTVQKSIEGQMTKEELSAAKELGRWYDEAYKEFGIERDFVENYMPHVRELALRHGDNDVRKLWTGTNQGRPLPKGLDFFADHIRTGVMDIYDTNAIRVAYRYAHAGSSNRFMKEPLSQARRLLTQVPDGRITKPMSEYLEALSGFEFFEQREMINRTLNAIFGKLPGMGGDVGRGMADKLSDMAIGLGYMSTLAYRFPAVLRNYTQLLHTTLPIFGTANGAFVEGIGRAMTRAGKLQAIEDGAISMKSTGGAAMRGMRETVEEAHPMFKQFGEMGFKMYDNADEFTRAATYWIGRQNASISIAKYARSINGANVARSKRALDKLLLDSKMYTMEENVRKEFLRRMVNDPESAARYAGKQFADVTQFLYGRGMQPYWMRSAPGRFFGQYGTWTLWYADYLRRTSMNLWRAGHKGEAMKFIGRNVMVNMAVLYAGHEVLEVDLSRWTSYGALFYSGGPGTQIAFGGTQLFRGLSDVTTLSESEFAQSHVTQGVETLVNAGQAFIPFRSAARDMYRVTEAVRDGSYHSLLAAFLGARETKDYTIQEQLDALFPGGPLAYQEWMRYDPQAPVGSTAAQTAEEEYWKRKLTAGGQKLNAPSPGLPPVGQRTPEQLGLTGSPPIQAQLPKKEEPAAESKPLER
jgi:hypothetical protein